MRKTFFLFLIVLLVTFICNSQDLSAKQTVDSFLNSWLVKKDMRAVQKNFAKNIFANKFLFAETCLGKTKQIKRASTDFLREVAQNTNEKSLENTLIFDKSTYNFKAGELLSVPEKEKFFLVKLSSNNLLKVGNSDENDYFYQNLSYIKSNFIAKEYLFLILLVKTKMDKEEINVPIYLIWIKQPSDWKIIQFGMACQ